MSPRSVALRNVDLTMPGGATAAMSFDRPVPEAERHYPENRMFGHIRPAWGLFQRLRHQVAADFRAHDDDLAAVRDAKEMTR